MLRRPRRPLVRLALPFAVLLAAVGCGVGYKLPTEIPIQRGTPTAQSYQMISTWHHLTGINDILLTPGTGSQLFLLFNDGVGGPGSHGTVLAYPRTGNDPGPLPLAFLNMLNPVKMYSGGNRLFVLDQGDTCGARFDPLRNSCEADATPPPNNRPYVIFDYTKTWRVREYGLLGGDTLSTFTDTTLSWVNGIAADDQGRVYVSGIQTILVIDPNDSRLHTRESHFQINRYARGPRYAGVTPNDRNMPGAAWHRDTTWTVFEGSGVGSIVDARGLAWGPRSAPAVYAADFGKDWAQKISADPPGNGIFEVDFGDDKSLKGPQSVAVDNSGFLYVIDTGNLRALRFSPSGDYVQRVDVDPDADGQRFVNPVGIAVDDSVAYVADRTLGKVVRYLRRSL